MRADRKTNDDQELVLPRIVGGKFRGRKLQYSGDARTRPMKERVREAVFNLVGPAVQGAHAIDLFAGTGALGLEAISRGAAKATFIEQHFPTAFLIRKNAEALEIRDQCTVEPGNTFIWAKKQIVENKVATDQPWIVFCSPPYAFYVDRKDEMLELITGILNRAPLESVFIVEADLRFNFAELPRADEWDVREYPPASVGVLRNRQR